MRYGLLLTTLCLAPLTFAQNLERSVGNSFLKPNTDAMLRQSIFPTCAANQLLGVNNGAFVCKSLPTCTDKQFLTTQNGQMVCGDYSNLELEMSAEQTSLTYAMIDPRITDSRFKTGGAGINLACNDGANHYALQQPTLDKACKILGFGGAAPGAGGKAYRSPKNNCVSIYDPATDSFNTVGARTFNSIAFPSMSCWKLK